MYFFSSAGERPRSSAAMVKASMHNSSVLFSGIALPYLDWPAVTRYTGRICLGVLSCRSLNLII